MLEQTQRRRRVRAAGRGEALFGRELEIALVQKSLSAALTGSGGVVVIEAPAGQGKSRLLTIAGDLARENGMRVLGAVASRVEFDFAFGVAIQLFETLWISLDSTRRERLLAGPAHQAGRFLEAGLPDPRDATGNAGYQLIHAFFALTANLVAPLDEARARPTVMLVDDLHKADAPSQRFLAYLAERLSSLPIVLVTTVTPAAADQHSDIEALSGAPSTTVLHLGELGHKGAESLVRSRFPSAEPEFVDACFHLTAGNPFLLTQVLEHVLGARRRPDAAAARWLAEIRPQAIVRSVLGRLGSAASDAQAIARAVSVLGDGLPVQHSAHVAGIEFSAAVDAADELAAINMLREGEPLTFVQPLVRSVVAAAMPKLARGKAHRRAAQVLYADGRAPEIVAEHLLCSPPEADPEAIETLRLAACLAHAGEEYARAVCLLERALSEHPTAEVRAETIAELAEAEAAAGLPGAVERLGSAIAVTTDPDRRAELVLVQSRTLREQGRNTEAVAALRAVLDVRSPDADPALTLELEAAYVASASLLPELIEQAPERRLRLVGQLGPTPTNGQRVALAHVALRASLNAIKRVTVRELADLAWGNGEILKLEGMNSPNLSLLTTALTISDEPERALELCDAAEGRAPGPDQASELADVSYCRAWALYERGRIADACRHARTALDSHDEQMHVRPAYATLASCLMQQGQLDTAHRALASLDDQHLAKGPRYALLLDLRAQLRLAQHRPQEALDDALLAGRILEESVGGRVSPGAIAWRSTAALAHLALGEKGPAGTMAWAELKISRRAGLFRVVIRDLRIVGLAAGGDDGLQHLAQAVHTGEKHPQRLEAIHALIDLGAALRRANRRADAREPLRRGLELAYFGGATALADHARTELAAAGARPRRIRLSGVDALTPSQRRVADLAAQGLTTKLIAEELFVSPKTVEFHLRQVYRALDVGSRDQLAQVWGQKQTA